MRQIVKQTLHKQLSVANMVTSFEAGYFSFPSTKHLQGNLTENSIINPSRIGWVFFYLNLPNHPLSISSALWLYI